MSFDELRRQWDFDGTIMASRERCPQPLAIPQTEAEIAMVPNILGSLYLSCKAWSGQVHNEWVSDMNSIYGLVERPPLNDAQRKKLELPTKWGVRLLCDIDFELRKYCGGTITECLCAECKNRILYHIAHLLTNGALCRHTVTWFLLDWINLENDNACQVVKESTGRDVTPHERMNLWMDETHKCLDIERRGGKSTTMANCVLRNHHKLEHINAPIEVFYRPMGTKRTKRRTNFEGGTEETATEKEDEMDPAADYVWMMAAAGPTVPPAPTTVDALALPDTPLLLKDGQDILVYLPEEELLVSPFRGRERLATRPT